MVKENDKAFYPVYEYLSDPYFYYSYSHERTYGIDLLFTPYNTTVCSFPRRVIRPNASSV